MCSPSSAGDNAGKTPLSGSFSVLEEQVRGSVRRDDLGFKANIESLQLLGSVLHDLPVIGAAHDDTHLYHSSIR